MAEEVKGTVTQTTQTGTEPQTTTQQNQSTNTETQNKTEPKVDVEKVKSEALSGFLKELGVEDAEALRGIVTKAKEDEDKNKTELERKNDTLTQTTKELAEEREARIIAEAKFSAVQLGAKPDLVEDLVVIAKSRVTKDKDINAVIAEIKDSASGKVYFQSDEEEETEEKGKKKDKTVTRARVTKPSEKPGKKEEEKGGTETKKEEHAGSMAERLLAGRKAKKSHYFS